MKLTDRQIKRGIKGMIHRFYCHNFAPRDMEDCFGKNCNLSLEDFLTKEYSKYNLKQCFREFSDLVENIKLIEKSEKESGEEFKRIGMNMNYILDF